MHDENFNPNWHEVNDSTFSLGVFIYVISYYRLETGGRIVNLQ